MSDINKLSYKDRLSQRIQAGKIAKKLEAFALASPEKEEEFSKVQMTQGQVTAAKALLNKVVPDLKSVEQFIKDDRRKTREELDAIFVAAGMNPKEIWDKVTRH